MRFEGAICENFLQFILRLVKAFLCDTRCMFAMGWQRPFDECDDDDDGCGGGSGVGFELR